MRRSVSVVAGAPLDTLLLARLTPSLCGDTQLLACIFCSFAHALCVKSVCVPSGIFCGYRRRLQRGEDSDVFVSGLTQVSELRQRAGGHAREKIAAQPR